MIRINEGRMSVLQFTSITDLDTYLSTATTNAAFAGKTLYSTSSKDPVFTGTYTYTEAHDLLINGWLPEAQKLENRLKTEQIPDTLKKSVATYDVAGQTACVPRYLNGMPDSMVNRKMVVRKAPVIDLYRSITYPYYFTQQKIEDDGLYTLQLVNELERRGVRVKLHIYHTCHESQTHGVTLVIKQPDERLNISKLAFPLVHTAMLRRIAFKLLETNQDITDRKFEGGYGIHTDGTFTQWLKKSNPHAFFVDTGSRHKMSEVVKGIMGSAK